MPVNISVKNMPDDIAERLRQRAKRHHRSLQGELMAILESSVKEESKLTPQEVLTRVRSMGLSTPSRSAVFIREDRDARSRR